MNYLRRIGIWSASATKRGHNVHESPVVLDPPLGASRLLLFLFLLFNFWGLTFNLA